jgi:hypothetical protein
MPIYLVGFLVDCIWQAAVAAFDVEDLKQNLCFSHRSMHKSQKPLNQAPVFIKANSVVLLSLDTAPIHSIRYCLIQIK